MQPERYAELSSELIINVHTYMYTHVLGSTYVKTSFRWAEVDQRQGVLLSFIYLSIKVCLASVLKLWQAHLHTSSPETHLPHCNLIQEPAYA